MEPEADDAAGDRAAENCSEVDTGTSKNAIPKRTTGRNLAFMLLITIVLCVFSI